MKISEQIKTLIKNLSNILIKVQELERENESLKSCRAMKNQGFISECDINVRQLSSQDHNLDFNKIPDAFCEKEALFQDTTIKDSSKHRDKIKNKDRDCIMTREISKNSVKDFKISVEDILYPEKSSKVSRWPSKTVYRHQNVSSCPELYSLKNCTSKTSASNPIKPKSDITDSGNSSSNLIKDYAISNSQEDKSCDSNFVYPKQANTDISPCCSRQSEVFGNQRSCPSAKFPDFENLGTCINRAFSDYIYPTYCSGNQTECFSCNCCQICLGIEQQCKNACCFPSVCRDSCLTPFYRRYLDATRHLCSCRNNFETTQFSSVDPYISCTTSRYPQSLTIPPRRQTDKILNLRQVKDQKIMNSTRNIRNINDSTNLALSGLLQKIRMLRDSIAPIANPLNIKP